MRPPEELRYALIQPRKTSSKEINSISKLIKIYFFMIMGVIVYIGLKSSLASLTSFVDHQIETSPKGYALEGFLFFSLCSPMPLIIYLESLEKPKFENGELILVGVVVGFSVLSLTWYIFHAIGK